ncbi:hypothetical protein D3C84_1033500 [compost metagenome]
MEHSDTIFGCTILENSEVDFAGMWKEQYLQSWKKIFVPAFLKVNLIKRHLKDQFREDHLQHIIPTDLVCSLKANFYLRKTQNQIVWLQQV